MRILLKQIKKLDFSKIVEIIMAGVLMLSPLVSFAVAPGNVNSPIGSSVLNGVCSSGQVVCNSSLTLTGLITVILQWVLGLAGLVAVIMLIIGGFLYMTAGGNDDRMKKAKKYIYRSLIGLVIVIVAFVIVSVISNAATGLGQTGTPQ